MREIYIEYIDNYKKYRSIETERDYYLMELDKLPPLDCRLIDAIELKICELTENMYKVRDIYILKLSTLESNRFDGDDYKYCYYNRTTIDFLTTDEYNLLKRFNANYESLTNDELHQCAHLINNNIAAHNIVGSYTCITTINEILNKRQKKWWQWIY